MPLHGRNRHDPAMRVLKVLARFLRSHRPRLQHGNARDDLETIDDAVLHLLEQHLFLPQKVVRLFFEILFFQLYRAPLCHILETEKHDWEQKAAIIARFFEVKAEDLA